MMHLSDEGHYMSTRLPHSGEIPRCYFPYYWNGFGICGYQISRYGETWRIVRRTLTKPPTGILARFGCFPDYCPETHSHSEPESASENDDPNFVMPPDRELESDAEPEVNTGLGTEYSSDPSPYAHWPRTLSIAASLVGFGGITYEGARRTAEVEEVQESLQTELDRLVQMIGLVCRVTFVVAWICGILFYSSSLARTWRLIWIAI